MTDPNASTPQDGGTAVLLVNLGTPEAPTRAAVKRYLAQFLHDHRVVDLTRWLWCPILHFAILPLRSGPVAKKYASIWTPAGSPLMALTRGLAEKLQHQMPDARVRMAMRYGQPSVASVLRELREAGLQKLLVLPLYPQYSATTTASVFDAVMDELSTWREQPELRLVKYYHRDPAWLDAMEARLRAHWDLHGRADRLLLSFHGIPQRFVRNGDPYARQCEASAAALAARLGLPAEAWQLTYQSRFGREPWLQPYTDHALEALARQGVESVDIACPGFAVDCLETLEEIAVENAHAFKAAGGRELRYVSALNDEPGHVAALSAIAHRHLQGWS